ncbi:MAG: glycerol-3-phosphate 1-O-acyltransferase PlsY [candidate division WOR-3 bacterium]|nr:glycerol-3-phosphate 1-O-acyltransferase PlsY [candidate division WOR-3 bacterium]MCX7837584.1 glycerol-3-phosphate 1-O-acyltransferase PlsY [candidate division WOR-3 bacterium]MDW8113483.1 glycerol-3-phosphate 1-O-acyltransferase PlsY [candidate division WOR-3 bacterium]
MRAYFLINSEIKILAIIFFSLFIGFLFGGIPFGYLIPKIFKKIDIRNYGSKNIGFTNVYRTLGYLYGIPVLILDISKGFFITYFSKELFLLPVFVGIGAILGHLFTPYLRFKGGKGVATTIGVLLALAPKNLIFSLIIFLIVLIIFSYMSLASISFALSLPLSFILIKNQNPLILIFFIIISILIILKHIPNIKRVIRKEEPKFRLRVK